MKIALLLPLLVLFAGCLPIRRTISPAVTGVALDAQTRKPVSGAEAVIAYSRYPAPTSPEALANTRPSAVSTTEEGTFSIPAGQRREWQFILAGVDYIYPCSTLLVKADGYVTAVVPVTTIGARPTNVAEVLLVPRK